MSKKFECNDGTVIEVKSDNAIKWSPDTCLCVLVFESDILELDFAIQVCKLHSDVKDVDLLTTVLKHNSDLNTSIKITTDADIVLIAEAKESEIQTVKALGDPEIKTDSTNKDDVEADLNAKGR